MLVFLGDFSERKKKQNTHTQEKMFQVVGSFKLFEYVRYRRVSRRSTLKPSMGSTLKPLLDEAFKITALKRWGTCRFLFSILGEASGCGGNFGDTVDARILPHRGCKKHANKGILIVVCLANMNHQSLVDFIPFHLIFW